MKKPLAVMAIFTMVIVLGCTNTEFLRVKPRIVLFGDMYTPKGENAPIAVFRLLGGYS